MDKVLVTGGNSFLGRYVCNNLVKKGFEVISTYRDLKDGQVVPGVKYLYCNMLTEASCYYLSADNDPSYILHLAGYNGNIQMNLKQPFEIFRQNTTIANNLFKNLHTCSNLKKVVSVVASCSYPEDQYFLYPTHIFDGPPNYTVECHGYAKRHLVLLSKYLKQQYGVDAATACITTMYGPQDSLDLGKTKVMMSLIKRLCDAKKNNDSEFVVWGTGQAYRQFIHVKDAAELLVSQLFKGTESDFPVNITPNGDILISDLVSKIVEIVGYEGKIMYDPSKPDGQFRKALIAESELVQNYKFIPLDEGIKETVEWYKNLV